MLSMHSDAPSYYEFGHFRLEAEGKTLLRNGEPVALTPKLLKTLLVLVESNQQVVTKASLIREVWPDTHVEESNLAVNISHLRKLLGTKPDGQAYIETFSKRGYRFSAEVQLVPAGEARTVEPVKHGGRTKAPGAVSPPGQSAYSTTHPILSIVPQNVPSTAIRMSRKAPLARLTKPSQWSLRLTLVILTGVLTFSLLVLFPLRHIYRRLFSPAVHNIAILPFTNLRSEPEVDFLGFSLADGIISRLGNVGSLRVRPSSSVLKYRNETVDLHTIAHELRVQKLLTGTYIKDGDQLRITAQLVDVTQDHILWREVMTLKYDKLLTVQDQVVNRVIGGLQLTLSPAESEQLKRNVPTNARAYELYLRGVDHHGRGSFHVARDMFEKSLELDPHYAPSWAYLGRSHAAGATREFGGRESYERALTAYRKALEIDPRQVEARVFLASLLTDTNRVEEAVPLLRSVISQNPNHAEAHWELGYAYRYGGMLKESVAECEKARQLDPGVKIRYAAFNSYLYLGEYDKFIDSLQADDEYGFNLFYRGYAHLYLRDYGRAYSDFERAHQVNPTLYSMMGKVLAATIAGDTQGGRGMLLEIGRQMNRRGVCDPEVVYKVAQCYAAIGDKQSALDELDRSIRGGFFCYPYMRGDPLMDTLRDEPRYGSVLAVARARHERFVREFVASGDHEAASAHRFDIGPIQ